MCEGIMSNKVMIAVDNSHRNRLISHSSIPTPRRHSHKAYLFRQYLELVRIYMLPNRLHIVPILHDAMFHGIRNSQQTSEFLGASSDESVAFGGAGHDAEVLGPADTGEISRCGV